MVADDGAVLTSRESRADVWLLLESCKVRIEQARWVLNRSAPAATCRSPVHMPREFHSVDASTWATDTDIPSLYMAAVTQRCAFARTLRACAFAAGRAFIPGAMTTRAIAHRQWHSAVTVLDALDW